MDVLYVASFCTYQTEIGAAWRPNDYNAHDFIKAIKHRDINEYAWVPVAGVWHKFDNTNRHEVVAWFAAMVVDYLGRNRIDRTMVLVPVPGSRCDVMFEGLPRTALLAAAIANALDGTARVGDVLRWKTSMPSSSAHRGTRDPQQLFLNLVITEPVGNAMVILVDDVIASGGHLQACSAALKLHGASVFMAVCAGRAEDNPAVDPFAMRIEEIPEFTPNLRTRPRDLVSAGIVRSADPASRSADSGLGAEHPGQHLYRRARKRFERS